MASYADQLRERLAQISQQSEAATTWEQLKKARDRQRQANLAAINSLNQETAAYNQRLANYAQMYNSGRFVTPQVTPSLPTKKSSTKKSTTKKKKPVSNSLGSAFGNAFGSSFGNLFG